MTYPADVPATTTRANVLAAVEALGLDPSQVLELHIRVHTIWVQGIGWERRLDIKP